MHIAPTRTAAAVAAAVLVLSSCSSLPESVDFLSRDAEFLQQSPRAIAKTAFAEMQDVDSLRILGSVNTEEYGTARVDIRLDDADCVGSSDTDDGRMRFIKNSDGAWFNADDEFWRSQSSSRQDAATVLAAYSGAWVVLEEKKEFEELCDVDAILGGFKLDKGDRGNVDAGKIEKIGDADAVALTGRDGKKRSTVWVAVEAPHHVVKMTQTQRGKLPVEIFFEDFGVEVVAETPRKRDIVTIPGS